MLSLPLVVVPAPAAVAAATAPAGAYAEGYGLNLSVGNGAINDLLGLWAQATSSCPGGDTRKASVNDAGSDDQARAAILDAEATTDCAGATASALAQAENVSALGAVHMDAATATSTASCTATPTGSAQIVNLSVGGAAIPIPADVAPNTELPGLDTFGLRIIANEQHPASSGRGLVVNALHIIAGGDATVPVGGMVIRGDIIIGHTVAAVACPDAAGPEDGGAPEISFKEVASPASAQAGTTVTFTAKLINRGTASCEILSFIDHLAPAFEIVSTEGTLGKDYALPPHRRTDGGDDLVIRPFGGTTIGAGESVTQTIEVRTKDSATPGTYHNAIEIFCARQGDFISGPLDPVTVSSSNKASSGLTPEDSAGVVLGGGLTLLDVLALGLALQLRRARWERLVKTGSSPR